eukprot:5637716-Pyramimonas_sp.AAC.1
MHRRNDDEKEEEAAESAYTYTIIRVMISSFCHGGWQGGSAAAHQQEEEGISSAGLPGSAAATELCEPIFYDFSAAARAQKRVNLLGRGDDENNKDKNDENARGQHPTRSTSRRHSAVSTSRQKYPGLPTAVCMSVSLRSLYHCITSLFTLLFFHGLLPSPWRHCLISARRLVEEARRRQRARQ